MIGAWDSRTEASIVQSWLSHMTYIIYDSLVPERMTIIELPFCIDLDKFYKMIVTMAGRSRFSINVVYRLGRGMYQMDYNLFFASWNLWISEKFYPSPITLNDASQWSISLLFSVMLTTWSFNSYPSHLTVLLGCTMVSLGKIWLYTYINLVIYWGKDCT